MPFKCQCTTQFKQSNKACTVLKWSTPEMALISAVNYSNMAIDLSSLITWITCWCKTPCSAHLSHFVKHDSSPLTPTNHSRICSAWTSCICSHSMTRQHVFRTSFCVVPCETVCCCFPVRLPGVPLMRCGRGCIDPFHPGLLTFAGSSKLTT